jgi:hypothetical protein
MKICISCGYIADNIEDSCLHCKDGDLRVVTSMKISLGKFEGEFKLSDEEEKVLERLRGYEVISEHDNERRR